jgi:hypothetical protein
MYTFDQVLEVAQRVISGDNVTRINPPVCKWTYSDGSHCAVGEVLITLGVEIPQMGDDGNNTPFAILDSITEQFDAQAVYFLDHLQVAADSHETWGQALWIATIAMEEV